MSVSSFLRDIAECRAWERRLHAGSKETRKAAALPGWPEWVVPLILPLYGWGAWGTGYQGKVTFYVLIAAVYVLVVRGRLFPPTFPTEWEALALPSRRSWLLARWFRRWPEILWLGACTLGFLLFTSLDGTDRPMGVRWTVAGVFLLSPFIAAAIIHWLSLKTVMHGGASPLIPVLALIMVALIAGFSVFAFLARDAKGDKAYLASGLSALLAILVLLPTVPSIRTFRRGGRGEGAGVGTAAVTVTLLMGMAGTLSLIALAVSMVLAGGVLYILPGEDGMLRLRLWMVFSCVPVALVLAGDALRLLPRVDLGGPIHTTVRTAFQTRKGGVAPSAPIPLTGILPGGGLRAAAWSLYRGRWRHLRYPWLTAPFKAIWEARALVIGFFGVLILASGHGMGGRWGAVMGAAFTLFLINNCPSPLELPKSRRLHLLGAEFPDLVRHNRVWGFRLAVLPVLLGGVLVPFLDISPEKVPLSLRWAALAGFTGSMVLAKCGAFDHLLTGMGRVGTKAAWIGTVAALVVWLADPAFGLLVFGPAVLLVALVAVAVDLRDPEAAGRRLAAEAVDD